MALLELSNKQRRDCSDRAIEEGRSQKVEGSKITKINRSMSVKCVDGSRRSLSDSYHAEARERQQPPEEEEEEEAGQDG